MHLEKYHFETADDIEMISCKNCSFKTGSQTVYNKHFMFEVKHCRPDKKFAKCDYCDLLLPIAWHLKHHVKLFHADKLEGKTEVYSCSSCDYKVALAKEFETHTSKCQSKTHSEHVLNMSKKQNLKLFHRSAILKDDSFKNVDVKTEIDEDENNQDFKEQSETTMIQTADPDLSSNQQKNSVKIVFGMNMLSNADQKMTSFDTNSSNIAVDSSEESDDDPNESVIKTEPNIDDKILDYHPCESVIKTEPGIDKEEEIWNELKNKKRKLDPSTFCETVIEPQKPQKKKQPNSV